MQYYCRTFEKNNFDEIKEQLQFNEDTVWTGRPHDYARKGASAVLPEIRRLLREGKQKAAERLAMERLREKDREAGVPESAPLTEGQKSRIAELRAEAKAKLAEIEILRKKSLAESGGDPEKIREIDERYRVDRDRVERKLATEIERVRRGG